MGLWSYSNRKPLSFDFLIYNKFFWLYQQCTRRFLFRRLNFDSQCWSHTISIIKTGKPELRYQPYYPGYINRKRTWRPVSMLLRLYQGHNWGPVFGDLDSYSGLYVWDYDSQCGKPPRDLWLVFLCRIVKDSYLSLRKTNDQLWPGRI